MIARRRRAGFLLIPVLALFVAACGQAAPSEESTTTASPETTAAPETTPPPPTTTTVAPTTTTVAPTTTELAAEITEDPTVAVVNDAFEPVVIVVEAGTEVTWAWGETGIRRHDVVSEPGPDGSTLFESELQASGFFTYTFDEPGTYDYFCSPHRIVGMTGTVIVVP